MPLSFLYIVFTQMPNERVQMCTVKLKMGQLLMVTM